MTTAELEEKVKTTKTILTIYGEEADRLAKVIRESYDNYDATLEHAWICRVIESHERVLAVLEEEL